MAIPVVRGRDAVFFEIIRFDVSGSVPNILLLEKEKELEAKVAIEVNIDGVIDVIAVTEFKSWRVADKSAKFAIFKGKDEARRERCFLARRDNGCPDIDIVDDIEKKLLQLHN